VTLAELRRRQGRPTEVMRLAKLRGLKRLAPVERQPSAAELRRRRSARLVQHHPSDDTIVIELVEPADMPAVVRIVWPSAPTITTPAKLNEVAAKAMKILAYASTRYAQIRAQRRC
jgi:hypothetical protein